jgi:hypothetical protein
LSEDPDALRRRAIALKEAADAVTRSYNRRTWIRYALYFVPVPLLVVTLRLHMDAWHYLIAGGLYIAIGIVLSVIDGNAAAKRDEAVAAAERAQQDYEHSRVAAGRVDA